MIKWPETKPIEDNGYGDWVSHDWARACDQREFQRELELRHIQHSKDYNTWAATGKEGQ